MTVARRGAEVVRNDPLNCSHPKGLLGLPTLPFWGAVLQTSPNIVSPWPLPTNAVATTTSLVVVAPVLVRTEPTHRAHEAQTDAQTITAPKQILALRGPDSR